MNGTEMIMVEIPQHY